jgi:hypothetical protein
VVLFKLELTGGFGSKAAKNLFFFFFFLSKAAKNSFHSKGTNPKNLQIQIIKIFKE